MLGHKLKDVNLVRAYDRSAPRILAHGAELNQVWTNLIEQCHRCRQRHGQDLRRYLCRGQSTGGGDRR